MKKGIVLLIFAALSFVVVYCYQDGAAVTGGIDGTGASGGSTGCGNGCHNSATTDGPPIVQLDSAGFVVTSYHPGVAYTVIISASNGSTSSLPKFGFQVTIVKSTGAGTSSAADAGTWGTTLPTDVRKTLPASSGLPETIIEHSTPITATTGTGAENSTYAESIPWTAPAAGTGSVIIYGVLNEVNGNGQNTGDKYQIATHITITEAAAAAASVSIAETTGSSTICSSTSVTFTATPVNGGTAPTYQWDLNGSPVSGATAATYTTTTLPAGSDAITCVMTSNLSGVTGSPATSNQVTVTVNASVTPAVSISATATTICSGQSVTLSATPTNGGSTPAYQWKDGSTAISGATSSSYTSTSLTNGEVITCVLTSDATCASPATATSNAETITISGTTVTPSVSIVSSAGSSFCQNTSVTFTATATNGGTLPVYQWEINGTVIAGATASTYTSSALATGDTIKVVLTSSAQCASPATATSNSIAPTVAATVTPSITVVSSGGSSLCAGQSNTFTTTIVNGGSTPKYQWFNNELVIPGATGSTYTSSALTNGSGIICQLTSDAACASVSIDTSNEIDITIVSNAVPSVTIASNAGGAICNAESVKFTATPVNGGTAPTYQWYDSSTAISGATAATYTTTGLTNGEIVYCKMVSNSQCVTETNATSDSITISISGSVVPAVSISLNSDTVLCSGQNVTFTASPTNGGTLPHYQWYNGSAAISGATAATYSVSTLASGASISVVLTSALSCATPSTGTSNKIGITVSAGDTASVNVISSLGDTVCIGQTATLTATGLNGGASPQYEWLLNGNEITGATSSTYTPANINNGDVYVAGFASSLTCSAVPVVFSAPLIFTASEGGIPAVTIASNVGINICAGTSVTFTAVGINEGSAPAYQWAKNGIDVGGDTSAYTDNNLANGDIISCSTTSNLTCAVPDTASSNNVTMTVYNPPVPAITDSSGILVTSSEVSYIWYLNNTEVTNGTGRTLTPQANGSYTVAVTDVHGCQGTSAPYTVTKVGIAEISNLNAVSVYPNPADNTLLVDFNGHLSDGKIMVRLLDMNGSILIENNDAPVSGQTISMDLSSIQDGIYLLQITQNELNAYRKIVVSK